VEAGFFLGEFAKYWIQKSPLMLIQTYSFCRELVKSNWVLDASFVAILFSFAWLLLVDS